MIEHYKSKNVDIIDLTYLSKKELENSEELRDSLSYMDKIICLMPSLDIDRFLV